MISKQTSKKIISWIHKHELHTQFSRFLVIGGISTIISYSVFLVSLRVFGFHYIFANIMAFVFGISFGYPMNRRWTFDSGHHKNSHFLQYLSVYLTSLLIGTIFLRIAVDTIGIIPEVAFILAVGITTFTNFLGTKFFVFKKKF
jgi:putative flippase GtrA